MKSLTLRVSGGSVCRAARSLVVLAILALFACFARTVHAVTNRVDESSRLIPTPAEIAQLLGTPDHNAAGSPSPRPTDEFGTGSARYAAIAGIDTNLALPAITAIYSVTNHYTAQYVRNPACWAAGLDLTCVAVFNSDAFATHTNPCCPYFIPTRKAGTLISPRHIVFTDHYAIAKGATIRFVAKDNTVISRVLVDSMDVSNRLTVVDVLGRTNIISRGTDLRIGLLDSDVPTNQVAFARVLPSNYTNYFPHSLNAIGSNAIPSLCLDQEEHAEVADIQAVSTGPMDIGTIVFRTPTNPMEQHFYGNGRVSGDSGQPAFLVINGQLVIVTVWTSGGPGAGNFIHDCDAINSVMSQLGGGYRLTPIDLGGFKTY